MASLDWSHTRTPVAIVVENLEDGMTIDEVLEQFPVPREPCSSSPPGVSTRLCLRSKARSTF
jgi:uncharacterized protein DUF433